MPPQAPDPWKDRWKAVTPSQYPWEQEALDRLKATFATRAYRAWSNFDFISHDGRIYEVDLLLLTRTGLYLIEIKSWPGRLAGDTHTWLLYRDGSTKYLDNPILLARRKCQALKSVLQPLLRNVAVPYIQEVVYLSHPQLDYRLDAGARHNVYTFADTRRTATQGDPPMVGELCGCGPARVTASVQKAVADALHRAGVRKPNRAMQIDEYKLGDILDDGPGWQDRVATHATLEIKRRLRQYLYARQTSEAERNAVRRAARREVQFGEEIKHPGILRAFDLREHENGPAVLYDDFDPDAIRLDHFMTGAGQTLDVMARVRLVRKIAEALGYAHSRKVLHRALSPRSILVYQPASDDRQPKLMNWQTGAQADGTTPTGTVHVGALVEDASTLYLSPEAISAPDATGEYSDIFSLGAIAFFIFAGEPPAASRLDLEDLLRRHDGLRLPGAVDGVHSQLDELIQLSTCPDVGGRAQCVPEFLDYLGDVEEKLATPRDETVNPFDANPGDLLEGGFTLKRRLGQGGTALALLVERDGAECVLKIARTASDNATLQQEAEVLKQLRDRHVVELLDTLTMAGRTVLALARAGEKTLAERLQAEGPLQYDLLKRFGSHLLEVMAYLEAKGISHRDIKPANLGVASIGKKQLDLILFDFSLARAPAEEIRAGTAHYRDPFLSLRRPPRWDLQAERYAVAVTLYEMATNTLPRWGDGRSDPALVAADLVLEPERLDASVREHLGRFFERALARDWTHRFDNAEEMRAAWLGAFEKGARVAEPAASEAWEDTCDADTLVAGLPLGPGAAQALDRLGVLTVQQLLELPAQELWTMRGVGNKTRRRLAAATARLRARFPEVRLRIPETASSDPVFHGIDRLVDRFSGATTEKLAGGARRLLALWKEAAARPTPSERWPDTASAAAALRLSAAAVRKALQELRVHWHRDKSMEALRRTIEDVVAAAGGVLEIEDLGRQVLAARGCVQGEPDGRLAWARLVTRAALETEEAAEEPRYALRRGETALLVAASPPLADYALALGRRADELAGADPLLPSARALEVLREVPAPDGLELPDHRLLRLAAASGAVAALSSRQEIYPRGMAASRALVLAHGSLLGVPELSVAQIQARVSSRYPEAAPLPAHPELDRILEEAGWDFEWSLEDDRYVRPARSAAFTSGPTSFTRASTTDGTRGPVTPEVATARQFEERLEHAERDGAFLVMSVPVRHMEDAERELRRFDVDFVELDALLIEAMRRQAESLDVRWPVVLEADAGPEHAGWKNLLRLAEIAMEDVEDRLSRSDRTILLSRCGPLARYDLMGSVERLRDRVGRRDGLAGLWMLVPSLEMAELPMLDGKAVPLLTAGQRARIPQAWLENRHRGRDGAAG